MKNVGTGPMTFISITTVGSSFTLDTNNSTCSALATLAAGASCTYLVAFFPQSATALSGSLTIHDNSSNPPGPTQTVTFTGNGTVPAPIITITPTSLDFGTTTGRRPGQRSADRHPRQQR